MIRINLLAKKTTKKKAGAIQHLLIGAAALALLTLALVWIWIGQRGKISTLRTQITAQQAEKERLKTVNDDKARYEAEQGELERKLDIITKLQKERIVPVHLLDELTLAIGVTTPIWLTTYNYTPAGITMDGFSLSHEALRPLVDSIEKSPYYKDVELLYSERSDIQGRELFRFSIRAGEQSPE